MSDGVYWINGLAGRLFASCVLMLCLRSLAQTPAPKKTTVQEVRSPEAVLAQVGSSVYIVEAISEHGDVVGQQTGVAISKHSIVSTRSLIGAFVSPKSRSKTMVARYRIQQGHQIWGVSSIYVDLRHDLVRFESIDLDAAPPQVADDAANSGQVVYAVSYSKDQSETVTKGRLLSGSDPNAGMLDVSFQSDGEAAGGGVFDPRGRLVGILVVDPLTGRTAAAPIAWSRLASLLYSETPVGATPKDKSKDMWLKVQVLGLNLNTWCESSLSHQGKSDSLCHSAEDNYPDVKGVENSRMLSLFDERAPETFANWPTWRKAIGSMEELRLEMKATEEAGAAGGSDSASSLVRTTLATGRELWSEISDTFCAEVPGASFTDLEGKKRACPSKE